MESSPNYMDNSPFLELKQTHHPLIKMQSPVQAFIGLGQTTVWHCY
jgi:hypothetical protein